MQILKPRITFANKSKTTAHAPRLRSSIVPPAKGIHTTYYPYGEPTVKPTGQSFLFGGKEREHAAARAQHLCDSLGFSLCDYRLPTIESD